MSAGGSGRLNGWMDGGNTVFLLRGAPTLILFLVGAVLSFMIQGPRLLCGLGRDEAAVTSPPNVKSNMHETVMGGWPGNFLLPRSPSLHSPSLSWKTRSTNRAAAPSELGELKVEALWSEEQS